MISRKWRVRLWSSLVLLPFMGFSQMGQGAVFTQHAPDFGGVFGTWGQVQYYRPFGLHAILVNDWKELTQIHPLTGEPFNTDRVDWMHFEPHASLWEQSYPGLVSQADTLSPITIVSYKQGDLLFKDFNLWYASAMNSALRFGWYSKLRSQYRALNFSSYDEQQHMFQLEAALPSSQLRLDVGYKHQLNPLSMFYADSSGLLLSNDSLKFLSDRWEGQLLWSTLDSLGSGREVFLRIQNGDWTWSRYHERASHGLAYVDQRFPLFGRRPFQLKIGYQFDQLGTRQFSRLLASVRLPPLQKGNFQAQLGLEYLDKLLPTLDLSYGFGKFGLSYQTQTLVQDHLYQEQHDVGLIHDLRSHWQGKGGGYELRSWAGAIAGNKTIGYQLSGNWQLPWDMELSLSFAQAETDTAYWIMTGQQISWDVIQELRLLDGALNTHFKLWGRHLLEPQSGALDVLSFTPVRTPLQSNTSSLDILNYTVEAQVRSLVIAFTDSNVLQDPFWTNRSGINWDPQFSIMSNQIPEYRFRYLSLIWIFQN